MNNTITDNVQRPDVAVVAPSTPSAAKLHRTPRRKRGLGPATALPENPTPNDVAPCSECGKRFFSRKALFGHMRCHPERHWRGINPPPLPRPQPRPLSPATDEYEIATCLLLLASGNAGKYDNNFECSSCKKVFRSHQALGGHRASHKNVKGCFAMATATSSGPVVTDWAFCGPAPAHHGRGLDFDLNQPAAMEDIHDHVCRNYLDLRLGL